MGSDQNAMRKIPFIGILVAVLLILVAVTAIAVDPLRKDRSNVVIVPSPIPGGYRVTVQFEGDSNESWGNISILLDSGTGDAAQWTNLSTADLTSTLPPTTWHFGNPSEFGLLTVWLNVTDVEGDGYVSHGDFLDLTTSGARFSDSTQYDLVLMCESTGQVLWTQSF